MPVCDDAAAERISENLDRMRSRGAGYADARLFLEDLSENLLLYDGNLELNDTSDEKGLGVRVLYGGAWGFSATSDLEAIEECFDKALSNARTASKLVRLPIEMGDRPPHDSRYDSPVERDPFGVGLLEKLELLSAVDEMLERDWIERRLVRASCQKRRVLFRSTEGTTVEKNLTNVFGTMVVMAQDCDGQMQRRSHSLYTTGRGTRGWELIADRALFADHAPRIVEELSELRGAPVLKRDRRSVILLPGQGALQVHETIGHPLELDRILGYEISYAGGSHVALDDIGSLRYGSDRLNASSYGAHPNSPGTFGFDDDGTPERDYLLIDRGILVDVLSSRAMVREANRRAGREVIRESGGAARASAFYRAPIERMTNINVLPGDDGSLEDITGSTDNGVIMDNPTSWSIGSNREHFHFGCEIAWEVKGGRRRRVMRNPTYQGHTLEFYGSLDAVGDAGTWRLEQVDNCGKGEPNQVMQIGHGVPVMRFADVITGEKE
ncbi:TldD/PmbA family protein [Candidatus Fermentibacterales bacterium]|nr:TldD/PmbA family protein [Candidatus Fermentibacterales bacterium]